jgi:predicted DNA-binding transcriptional regulator AlpA
MLKLLLNDPSPKPSKPCNPLTDPQENSHPSSVLDGFLRREELARELGVSPRTVDRWQALRDGPPRLHVGRTILYSVDSVREWLRSREQTILPNKRQRRFRAEERPLKPTSTRQHHKAT